MSFWDLESGETALTGKKEIELESGNLAPIPDGSNVLAFIDEAKWQATRENTADYISLRWCVQGPEEFVNRKIYQKLWVTDDDPNAKDATKAAAKRDKAKKMLATIDANAGGKLARSGKMPTDDDLTLALQNKPMVIRCQVWEMGGGTGNWIAGVFPKSKALSVGETKPSAAKAKPAARDDDFGTDVPF